MIKKWSLPYYLGSFATAVDILVFWGKDCFLHHTKEDHPSDPKLQPTQTSNIVI